MYLDHLELKKDPLQAKSGKTIDLRCRVICAFVFIATAVSISNYYILTTLIIVLTILLMPSIRIVLLRLIPVNIFTLMLWVSLPLGVFITTYSEGVINTVSYTNALYDALRYTLRINTAALLTIVFIIPVGISGLSNALSKLAVPKKLVALILLSYRYIFVMFERISVSLLSLRLREPPKRATLDRWRTRAALVATALLSAEQRSQKVWLAMQSRGFTGTFPVTATFRWKLRDTIILVSALLFSFFLLLLDRKLDTWIF
jgi:cobalt/nickel transport system permease protein